MPARHVNRRILEAFERGEVSAPCLLRFLGSHLLDCPDCQPSLDEWAKRTSLGSNPATADLAEALRVAATRPTRKDRKRAEQELHELLAMDQPERRLEKIDRALTRFRSPLLANLLLDESNLERLRDPANAEHYVDLAQKVLWRSPASSLANEVRVRASALFATALKSQGRYDEAERAFEATRILRRSIQVTDLDIEAEILLFEGSFLRDRRRLEAAEKLLRRSISIYEMTEQPLEAARARLTLAGTLFHADRVSEAIIATERAIEAINPLTEPLLHLMAHHNIELYLCELGRFDEAAGRFSGRIGQYEKVRASYPLIPHHFHWLAGRIQRGLGNLPKATDHLTRARDGFAAKGTRYDAVLVCLDLCVVHLQAGRPDEVLELADLMLNSYAADGLHQEAMAAVRLFAEAAQAKAVHTDFVRRVFRFLELSQADPTYRCNLSVPSGD